MSYEIYLKSTAPLLLAVTLIAGCAGSGPDHADRAKTICNPMDLGYRFQPDEPSRREAADPTVILFRDTYFLFASKSGGYWYSDDLADWTFIETGEIPTEDYAPTAIAIDDTVYFLASSTVKSTIYRSADPITGHWEVARDSLEVPVWDPAFFQDDDGRVYLYWGCSNVNPIMGVEVDHRNGFRFMGGPKELIHADPGEHGWEVPGDYNTRLGTSPWIEGAWMNKQGGMYYLQYAGPGTEFKSYSDGVYVSEDPLGPFRLQEHNPFSYKPEGFAAGAGHGSTFRDKYGNWWHIGTMTISQKHVFERRLGLFPAFIDDRGILHAETRFGDYPMVIPREKVDSAGELFPGWMLLSYNKGVSVSSSIDTLPPSGITDEDIRTSWAAESGTDREWVLLDLGEAYDLFAVQVNFAEHDAGIYGRQENLAHRFMIEFSDDNHSWEMLADRSASRDDHSHVYIQLPEKITGRYLRLKNIRVPGGHLALSGFRVFGKGSGEKPPAVRSLVAERDPANRRTVRLTWDRSPGATGYNIRYGTDPDRLYHNYSIYGDTSVVINSLHTGWEYFFSVEAFNENGISGTGAAEPAVIQPVLQVPG